MAIRVKYRGKEYEIDIGGEGIKVKDLLGKFNLSPSYSIVIKEDSVLEERDIIKDGESVRIVNAISGGV